MMFLSQDRSVQSGCDYGPFLFYSNWTNVRMNKNLGYQLKQNNSQWVHKPNESHLY